MPIPVSAPSVIDVEASQLLEEFGRNSVYVAGHEKSLAFDADDPFGQTKREKNDKLRAKFLREESNKSPQASNAQGARGASSMKTADKSDQRSNYSSMALLKMARYKPGV